MTKRMMQFVMMATMALTLVLLGGCRSYPNCATDAHCAGYAKGTNYCVDTVCRSCRDDASCGEGQRCSSGACFAIPGWCKDDAMCASPGKCRGNACGPECLGTSDCGLGQECRANRCKVTGSCDSDADCGGESRCEANMCVARVAAPTNDNCEDGRAFRTVYFDFDESTLTESARADLAFNKLCIANSSATVALEGHCDERGTEEYNLALGERRSRAVKNYLTSNGTAANRLSAISYGETRPADSRTSDDAWSRNRRVEFAPR